MFGRIGNLFNLFDLGDLSFFLLLAKKNIKNILIATFLVSIIVFFISLNIEKKYLSEATEEIIKFTSYNPGIPLTIINGSYVNSPVEVSGKLILPKEGKNLPVVVTVHSSGGPSEFTDITQSWRNDFKNQLLKNIKKMS